MPDPSQLERLCVVLVAARNPLNIGAAARAMSNFGFTDLRLVNPYELAFREARSAVGASALLANAREYKTVADAVADCTLVVGTTAATARELQHPLVRLEQAAPQLRGQLVAGRAALLFGSERRGLSNDDLSHCHWLLRIPTREDHGSMNLGQTVAVCLYEIVRTDDAAPRPEKPAPATAAAQERITAVLLETMHASGNLGQTSASDTEARTRRMIRRLELSQGDAEACLGILRQVLWKLRSKD